MSQLQSEAPAQGRYAAIDIGTVTTRMLIADVLPDGSLEEIDKEYEITNLGEGVDASGELLPAAIERTAQAVRRYCAIRDTFGADIPTVAMATSASRDAKNAREFVDALAQLGVHLSVIPGEVEANLSFVGASVDFTGEPILVVDVGGGSTETIVGIGGKSSVWPHSFNVGCRRVTEKFLHSDPFTASELDEARTWVRAQFDALLPEALATSGVTTERMVAVAGTATTLVSIREAMTVYDSAKVHGQVVTREQLDDVFARLSQMPLAERQQVVGLDPRRAPVIVAGFLILQELMDIAGMDSFTVSETDILHGMILHEIGLLG